MSDFTRRWQRPEVIEAIFDQISDGVFLYDQNLYLVGVNKSGEKLLGLSAIEMLGKPSWNVFRVVGSGPASEAPAGQGGTLPTGTLSLEIHGGGEKRVILQAIELRDEAGTLEGVVATATEIKEREQFPAQVLVPAEVHPAGVHPVESEPNGAHRAETQPAAGSHTWRQDTTGFLRLHKRTASLAGVLFLLFVAALVASKYAPLGGHRLSPEQQQRIDAEKSRRAALAAFNAMTPAQHIERAKLALRPGATADAIDEGLRNVKAIPASAPESRRAKSLEADLSRAKNVTMAQMLIDAAPNSDLKDGLGKLDRATAILQSIKQQNPNDSDAVKLSKSAASAAEQLAMRSPEEFAASEIKLTDFRWERGGFGTVMVANFTFRNDSPTDVGDLKIHCEHHDAEGVLLDQNEGTAFGIVKAHSSTRIGNVNLGFLSSQAAKTQNTKTNCEIVSLRPASQSVMYRSTP